MYRVKLEQFEGPLDLLLEIVESRELNLVKLPLAELAEQFLQYLETLEERSMEEMAQFLVVGSRLALLKSRELVPSLDDELEADGEIETLKRQLMLYRPFRHAASLLKEREREGARYHAREAFAGHAPIFYLPEKVESGTLAKYMAGVLRSTATAHLLPKRSVKSAVALKGCINELLLLARGEKQFDFSMFLQGKNHTERVVHFIGLLELVRMGKISVQQKRNFGTIVLTSHNI